MPHVTLVVPAYNTARTLEDTLSALLAQTFRDFEIVVVDDGSTDSTASVVRSLQRDPRLRLVQQRNRGLAGARNTGIAEAKGALIGFCDADDLWEPWKLQAHVRHLNDNPQVGVSYAGSALIDDEGAFLKQAQRPRLTGIDAAHILKRNPIGNGSAPVIRRAVFDEIAYRPAFETRRDWYFDETFRQSEDIECWMRIALTTNWQFEGVPGLLTRYRISAGGLSAATDRQLASWERMIAKLTPLDPAVMTRLAPTARAYQLRYLARRAVSDGDGERAWQMVARAFAQSRVPLIEEPVKTLTTLAAAAVLRLGGQAITASFLPLKAQRS
ncbi:glycosyltransferase family 2 protein [Salipiger sp. IMCC34102]|uniref:glycosyltransferase family 2 protein n=1 Tax=Salipiger sp. IMCC34102 TaxID=2510647 RepID=UPI00101C8996|nr:glycosyltransferase family 2 protein [Salipiger sp. IMCC34102]RYH01458.1 glycosyltransferase family 2 protein [Salipiger sp. IMCC34102]